MERDVIYNSKQVTEKILPQRSWQTGKKP